MQKYNVKSKNGFRIKCGMTDVRLILCGGRFLHSVRLRRTSVEMTGGEIATRRSQRPRPQVAGLTDIEATRNVAVFIKRTVGQAATLQNWGVNYMR